MKIKRFTAKDIRAAISCVRKELGPDAVILSNRVTGGGVEIVAAMDYDEVLYQGMTKQSSSSTAQAQTPAPASPSHSLSTATEAVTTYAPASVPAVRDQQIPRAPIPEQGTVATTSQSDETLLHIRQELDDMKGLLEHQLSGLVWGDKARRNPLQTRLLQLLLEAGFQPGLCEQVASKVPCEGGFDRMRRMALGLLAHRLAVLDGDLVEQGGVVALVGPTGVGKTTTLAKLAARAVLKTGPGQLALITTDNYRVGAHEQLRTFGRLLDVPVRIARNAEDLDQLLNKLADKHLVLIDTAGVSQRDARLVERLHALDIKKSIRSFLVLSAATEISGLEENIWQFQQVGLSGCIVTKLDEAVLLGGVISAVIEHGLPVACVTDGQRVPEDLKIAKPHVLISRTIAKALQYQQQRRRQNTQFPFVRTGTADQVALAMAFGRS